MNTDKHRSAFICVYLWLAITSFARASPNFAHDIAPVIYEKCAPCHHPGQAAPFSLLTYEDVKKRATQIAAATKSGYMPPWLPEPGYGNFQDDRRLTPAELKNIQDWVHDGGPEGPTPHIPPPS